MSDEGSSGIMLHPCQTVWTVGQLDNGDVITGGSDGKVRIWTKDEGRYALAEVREVSTSTSTPDRMLMYRHTRREYRRL
jgi:hypothetical protein